MTVHAWDKDWNLVDIDDPKAVTAEVHADDGMREYVRLGEFPEVEFGDTDAVDAQIESGATEWTLPTTIDELQQALGAGSISADRLKDRLAAVVLTPAWPNAPESLQNEVYAILAG